MYLWFEMYLMLSQKVVLTQFRFGMLGQRLEGEQALSTSSPWVLGLFVAWVPAEAAVWVRGWGSADVLCCVLHIACPLAQQDSVGTLELESLGDGVCTRGNRGTVCRAGQQGLQEAPWEFPIFRQVIAREVLHLRYFSSLPRFLICLYYSWQGKNYGYKLSPDQVFVSISHHC